MPLYNYRHRYGDSLVTKELSGLNISTLFDSCRKALKKADLYKGSNEQFCLIRANDILQFFMLNSNLSEKNCRIIVMEYSEFINEINYEMLSFLLVNCDPFPNKIIRYTQSSKGRLKLTFKLLIKGTKLEKYFSRFGLIFNCVRLPFVKFFNWLYCLWQFIILFLKIVIRVPLMITKFIKAFF